MGELSNALQGKMNSRKGHIKDPGERQLDLFSSLSDRTPPSPKILPPPPQPRSDLEMVLPPSKGAPPDVSADVRAVLSESGIPPRSGERPASEEPVRPLPHTGIYHRPQRAPAPPAPPSPPPPPRASARPRCAAMARIRDWFSGVELDRRMVSLVVVLVVLVALIAFWTSCPRAGHEAAPGTAIDLAAVPPAAEPLAPLPAIPLAPAPVALVAPAAPAAPAAAGWKVAGTEASLNNGILLVWFTEPVFVSTDKISIEGMNALNAVAAKLVTLNAGGRVIVTGYTDDVPMSRPTPEFQDNADLAAARAKVAVEHLSQFARANKKLMFEPQAGDPARAPYPNDSPANRRLNRTVTVQVIPAP